MAVHAAILLLLLPSLSALLLWSIVASRVRSLLRERPSVRRGLDRPPPPRWPRLSIIVPIHNEQRVIDRCAASLREQDYAELELIFVLDRCTDDTLTILRRHAAEDDRIIIIENSICPDDWAGKCHAAHLGAQRASGEYVLFTDADVRFDPGLCRASVAVSLHDDLALLSLLSTLTHDHRFERIAQPVAGMLLMRMYPLNKINLEPAIARPFANGQFLLFARAWYDRVGGHDGVREALLEDLAFARKINKRGGSLGLLLADHMLVVSMYGTRDAFRSGWQRIFIEACNRRPRRLRKLAWRALTTGVLFPAVQALCLIAALVGIVSGTAVTLGWIAGAVVVSGIAIQMICLARIYPLSGAPRRAIVAYPAGCVECARILFAAAQLLMRGEPVTWGGRTYHLSPRIGRSPKNPALGHEPDPPREAAV